MPRLNAELAAFDPSIDYVDVRRLDSFIDGEIRPWRLGAVTPIAGLLAIVVSVAGVFGLLTYVVTGVVERSECALRWVRPDD